MSLASPQGGRSIPSRSVMVMMAGGRIAARRRECPATFCLVFFCPFVVNLLDPGPLLFTCSLLDMLCERLTVLAAMFFGHFVYHLGRRARRARWRLSMKCWVDGKRLRLLVTQCTWMLEYRITFSKWTAVAVAVTVSDLHFQIGFSSNFDVRGLCAYYYIAIPIPRLFYILFTDLSTI